LECYKQKDAEFFRKRPFRLVSEAVSQSVFVEWGEYVSLTEERAETVRDAIIDLLASGPALNQSEIVKRLGAGRDRVRAALGELEQDGKVVTELGARRAKFYQLSF
jgi:DNA-binding GntR family transcriptional regulator